jgi:branched-chain amino acid transport system substrate-binding protein
LTHRIGKAIFTHAKAPELQTFTPHAKEPCFAIRTDPLNTFRTDQIEFKIGGIFPLTGYLSWSGGYKRKAAELKISIVNESGGIFGRPLRLIAYDDRSSAEQASLIAEKLVLKHRVVAMVGTGSLPVSRAVAAVANRYRTPAFVNSGYAIDPLKDLFVFNTTHKTEFAVACSFQYFIEKGVKRLALLMPFGPLGDLGSSLAKSLSNRMGIQIVGEERFDVASPDVRAQLIRLRDLKPLALFSFVTGQPTVCVSSTMSNLGMDLPLLVSHGNANPRFLKMVHKAPVKLIVPSGKATLLDAIEETDPCKNVVKDFCSRHIERYGEPANYYSAELSDAIDLVVKGLKNTGTADSEDLRDAVESTKNFIGMQGVYNLSPMDHYGTGIEEIVLLTAGDGAWRFEKTIASIDHFEDVNRDTKRRLIRVLADSLSLPSVGSGSQPLGKPDPYERMWSRPGPLTTAKLLCQLKQELSRSMRERDFQAARKALFHTLEIAILQDFENKEKLKLAALELFLLLFHAAIEEGDAEDMASLRHRFTAEWESLNDHESLCLWIVRIFENLKQIFYSMDRGKSVDLLTRVVDFIESHFSEELSVQRIAGEVCLSPSRLIHRMRDDYNTTVSSCVTEVRMKKAKTLLRDTNISISAIAQDVGYRDQSHFTKVFRKHVGCTPRYYRDSSVSSRTA